MNKVPELYKRGHGPGHCPEEKVVLIHQLRWSLCFMGISAHLRCVSCKVDPYCIGASVSLLSPALSASPVSIFPLRLPQSKTFIWPFFCLFFISRQEVISAKLTIDPVENSTNYYDVTVTVKSYVAKCLVVSEDLWVMVSGEREEKYPHKWFQSALLIWSETSSYKVTYKCFCMH